MGILVGNGLILRYQKSNPKEHRNVVLVVFIVGVKSIT